MAMLSVVSADVRLINLSTRAPIQGGANDVIAGFIIEGTGSQTVFIKGIGMEAGVDPKLTLKTFPDNNLVTENDNWQQSSYASELANYGLNNPTDAGLWVNLTAGAYTVTLSSVGRKGLGRVGVTSIDSTGTAKLINISTRAPIEGGANDVIAGLIIDGIGTQTVLFKGIGMEAGVNPKLTLKSYPSNKLVASNDDWQQSPDYYNIANYGLENLTDAGLWVDLSAGAYTVTLSSVGTKGVGRIGVNAINNNIIPRPDDTNGSNNTITLKKPQVKFSPTDFLNFGKVSLGTTVKKEIAIMETGNADLEVSYFNISGLHASHFEVMLPHSINISDGGAIQRMTIACTPSVTGVRKATLELYTNALDNEYPTFALKCEGVQDVVCPIDFMPTNRNDNVISSLGYGYDNQRDIFKPQSCMNGTTREVGHTETDIAFSLISNYEELKRHLDIEVNLKIKVGFFKLTSETKFATDHRETSLSRTLFYKFEVKLPNREFSNTGLNTFGQSRFDDSNSCFRSACGDQFVYQTTQGGKLYFALKFDFANEESKKEFSSKLSAGYSNKLSGSSYKIDVAVNKTSDFVKENGELTVSALQIGGNATKLSEIFGSQNGISPFLTCKLTAIDKCLEIMQNVANYAINEFSPNINSNNAKINSYETVSYLNAGIPVVIEPINPGIITARKDLAYKFEWQYGNLLLTRSWLDDYGTTFTSEELQYLRNIEKALDTNLDILRDAGMWCFSDLSVCLDKKQEAFNSLHYYNKDWLLGIKVVPPVIEEYSDENSFTINFKVDNGYKPHTRSTDGAVCLPDNCEVDYSRTKTNSKGPLGNAGGPGYGIDVSLLRTNCSGSASNTIEGRCLKSIISVCSERHYGHTGYYGGTHTIYGKCTNTIAESYLYVPPIP